MRCVQIALVLLTAMVLHGCQSAKNKASGETAVIEYTDWRYQNFPAKNGSGVIHGAVTTAKPEDPRRENKLFAFNSSGNCGRIPITIAINEYDIPFSKNIYVANLSGTVRIDDLAPHNISYHYEGRTGESTLYVKFDTLFDNETIRKQVQNGQMIRFDVEVEKVKRTFKFTLRNVNNAMATLVDNCKESSSFQGVVKGKPAQGQPSGKAPQGAPGKPGNDDDKQFFK